PRTPGGSAARAPAAQAVARIAASNFSAVTTHRPVVSAPTPARRTPSGRGRSGVSLAGMGRCSQGRGGEGGARRTHRPARGSVQQTVVGGDALSACGFAKPQAEKRPLPQGEPDMAEGQRLGRVALLVGGGPAPGINGVIAAATIQAVKGGA